MQSLMASLQNVEASRKQDLEILRAEMQGKISKDLEAAKRSWSEENLLDIGNQLVVFAEELQAQGRVQGDADMTESLKKENELLRVQRYKVDVTLDADTAHPRLQVSKDGKSVIDTGAIRRVPSKKERFDSHAFVLAKEAYASGRLYWEVDVGKRRNWILGVVQNTVTRKGTLVLSPQNGFWAIGLTDGRDYWAYTDPWTRLTVGGRPRKIGIFLDILAKKLLFYNVHQKNALYIFSFDNDCSQEMKLFPFFSTGSITVKVDFEPLQIVQGFDDDEKRRDEVRLHI
nr:butyrophilin subfamily 1 member A1 isoform X2 [Anas platyrhynchos]XP_038035148.1 butyrophilin subfamily 1 member A1 isoform X3 [Anas platyrhynchos]